jgi:hypothetical protein
MKSYRDALSRFLATDFGGGSEETPENAEALLRQDIREVMRSDTKYFNLCVGVLVVLFVLALTVVLFNLNHPASITAILSATGLSFGFILKEMIGLWREKSHAEVGYSLAVRLPPQDLKAVISVLLSDGK